MDLRMPRCRFGECNEVVRDHRRLVTVQIGELEWLVVDQDQDELLGSEESVKAVPKGDGLRHGRHSGLRISLLVERISPLYWFMISR
jgi:hypothetical protein